MADNSRRHPTKIRTFAADLEAERKKHGQETSTSTEKKSSTPKPTETIFAEPDTPVVTKTQPILHKPIEPTPHPVTIRNAPRTSTKIPAFHELKKSVAAIQENIVTEKPKTTKVVNQKKTRLERAKAPTRTDIGFDATVITDTKSDRFRLLPSVVTSIRLWFKKLNENRKRKKIPKYTVPEAERRKGVIQRATTKTGTIFSADNETIREQIRRRQSQKESPEDDEAETTWTPFTETGYPLLESPEGVQNVTVEYKNITPRKAPVEAPAIDPDKIIITEPSEPVEGLDESRWSTGYEEETKTISQEVVETPQSTSVEMEQEGRVTRSRTNLLDIVDTNTLTVALLVTVIATVAILFASRVIISKLSTPPAEPSITVPSEPIIPTARLVGVPLTVQTLNTLPDEVATAVASSSAGLVEYAVVSAVGDEVSASYLFELLHFRTLPNFRQSLTAVRFASINHSQPALVFSFVDIDTIRGGLLDWETTLPIDMAILYDIPQGISPEFIDETAAGIDVRVLRHEGTPVLVYGIIGNSTVLITTSTTDFTQIVELSKLQ